MSRLAHPPDDEPLRKAGQVPRRTEPAQARGQATPLLKVVRVDDEPIVPGDLVVERTPGGVRVVRLPVDPANPMGSCRTIHGMNELAADTPAARLRRSEKVLQVAGELKPGGATVIKVVREADERACEVRDKRVHGLGWVEET